MDRLGPLREGASLVAVSNTAVRHVIIDVQGKGVIRFSEQSTHPVSTAAWLKNGKAFITARGGTVGVNPVAGAEAAFSALLKLPGGPAICRISGDGKCLVVVQGNTKELQVFDLFPLLVSDLHKYSLSPCILVRGLWLKCPPCVCLTHA